MFTLEQKIFIVQFYFTNGERLENGEWSYSAPRIFEEFQQKFPNFQGTYHDLLYNNRPGHFIEKALRKCFRERANFRR
jgi:hypothetical protein